jgi:integrase
MNSIARQFGDLHATDIQLAPLIVSDLLAVLESVGLPGNQLGMLRSTVARICECLGTTTENLTVNEALGCIPLLKKYLQERRYSRNSIRSYCNYVRILSSHAVAHGCAQTAPELAALWGPVVEAVNGKSGCKGLVRYAMEIGKSPAQFGDHELEIWTNRAIAMGRTCGTANKVKAAFCRGIARAGLLKMFPQLTFRSRAEVRYGVSVSKMPGQLREEILAILEWKQAAFAPGRPCRSRHRRITADHLRGIFERIFGFVTRIQAHAAPDSVAELITQDSLTSFVRWSVNDRGLVAYALRIQLGMLYAAVRGFPALASSNFDWFPSILEAMPDEDESDKIERKARKTLHYDEVYVAVGKLAAAAQRATGRRKAVVCRNKLLVQWLLTLPWRQRNIRECRIGSPFETNIFKAELPRGVHVALPVWAKERLRFNPNETFWQFHFRPQEKKRGLAIRGILPRCIIPALEEYLAVYRPLLLNGRDPGTLFINDKGAPLSPVGVRYIISETTLRYCGRRVTPHICRDIFAYKWLDEHPEDYLTLSKILWHADVRTTLRIYGRNYDESNGVVKIDEWLGERH